MESNYIKAAYFQTFKNKKYEPNKKNRGIVPELTDPRKATITVRNYKAKESLARRGTDWLIRGLEEIRQDPYGQFITFTFSPDGLKELTEIVHQSQPGLSGYKLDNAIALKAWERFSLRWKNEFGTRPKHFYTTEIGGNYHEGLHIHAILWEQTPIQDIEKIWRYGFAQKSKKDKKAANGQWHIGKAAMKYITKYITKKDFKHRYFQPIVRATNLFGMRYIEYAKLHNLHEFKGAETNLMYRFDDGTKTRLPKIYYEKLFTPEEREQLTTIFLDKNTMYLGREEFKMDSPEDQIKLKAATNYIVKKQIEQGFNLITSQEQRKAEEELRRAKHNAKTALAKNKTTQRKTVNVKNIDSVKRRQFNELNSIKKAS